jgi:hypothetical protein
MTDAITSRHRPSSPDERLGSSGRAEEFQPAGEGSVSDEPERGSGEAKRRPCRAMNTIDLGGSA